MLSPSAVKLYGREISGLGVKLDAAGTALGANSFLRSQLEAAGARFARIYGFSFQGTYTQLNKPVILLVHGEGVTAQPSAAQSKQGSQLPASPVDNSGVAAKDWDFSADVRIWEYDRADFSLRLDVDSGPLERILIDREEVGEDMPYFRGQRTRLRGSSD